jgi:hypothetical protein
MILELDQIPIATLYKILESSKITKRQRGFIVVTELSPGCLLYQHMRDRASFAEFGDDEHPRLYSSAEEAAPETQLFEATRVAFWVEPSASGHAFPILLTARKSIPEDILRHLLFGLISSGNWRYGFESDDEPNQHQPQQRKRGPGRRRRQTRRQLRRWR